MANSSHLRVKARLRAGLQLAILALCLQSVKTNPGLAAVPNQLGDIDGDGVATVLDLARIVGHIRGTAPLSPELSVIADVNKDGVINQADLDELVKEILQTRSPESLPLATV